MCIRDRYTPQNEINDQVEALENAMIEVKASLVQEEQMVFYDKVTGIYVIAPVAVSYTHLSKRKEGLHLAGGGYKMVPSGINGSAYGGTGSCSYVLSGNFRGFGYGGVRKRVL